MSTVSRSRRPEPPSGEPDSFRYGWRYVRVERPDGRVDFDQVPLTLEDVLFPEVGDFIVQSTPHNRDVVYLKADDTSSAAFAREGQGPFTYEAKGGKRVIMSYWRLPDRLYDDPDELAEWARVALAVARRAKAPKPRPKAPKAKRKR